LGRLILRVPRVIYKILDRRMQNPIMRRNRLFAQRCLHNAARDLENAWELFVIQSD
jgi:hypothetical protein